jgi:hypothetical protein
VADWVDGVLQHLDAAGLIDYDPDGVAGNAFSDTLPATPNEAIALTPYGGSEPDSKLPYDAPNLQVRTRAEADPRVARARAWAIYSELNGLASMALPDGTWLVLCTANHTPQTMGQDTLGRPEYVVNFALELYAPSANRPA